MLIKLNLNPWSALYQLYQRNKEVIIIKIHKKTTWSSTNLSPNNKYFPTRSTITVDRKTKTNKTKVIFSYKNKNKSQNKTNKKLTQNDKYTIL